MTPHVLDNPAWNAMNSGNSHLGLGNERIKFFAEDVGPFAGFKNYDEASFRELYDLMSPGRVVIIPSIEQLQIPGYWKLLNKVVALQMIYNNPVLVTDTDTRIVSLNEEHIPEMIALTQLTNPGPFLQNTIRFGNYKGIFKSGKLVAMAGQRMHPYGYVEISAVCTHPDHTRKGYGRSLINNQVLKIVREGNIPFLHVRADNKHAIELYKRLGFTARIEMNIYVLQKEHPDFNIDSKNLTGHQ